MLRHLGRTAAKRATNLIFPHTSLCNGYSANAAAGSEAVQLPAQVFGVGGKYASALYVSAFKAKALDSVEKEMNELVGLLKSNPNFANFLKDPSVSKQTRVSAINEIFSKAEFTEITRNFLAVLADGGRLGYLSKTAEAYSDLLSAFRGEVKATVTSALELTTKEVGEITEALKGYLKSGETLRLTQKVDRSIIGGVVIDIGERHIDLSINSKIKKLEQVLAQSLDK